MTKDQKPQELRAELAQAHTGHSRWVTCSAPFEYLSMAEKVAEAYRERAEKLGDVRNISIRLPIKSDPKPEYDVLWEEVARMDL